MAQVLPDILEASGCWPDVVVTLGCCMRRRCTCIPNHGAVVRGYGAYATALGPGRSRRPAASICHYVSVFRVHRLCQMMFDLPKPPIRRKHEKVALSVPTPADGNGADQKMTDAETFPATYTGATNALL